MSPPRVRLVEGRIQRRARWIFMETRRLTVRQRRGCVIWLCRDDGHCGGGRRWLFAADGVEVGKPRRRGEGLGDRSSRPLARPAARRRQSSRRSCARASELREGPHVIGWALGSPPRRCTRCCVAMAAHGCVRPRRARRSSLRTARPGELLHVDIKKLGRILRARPPRHRRPHEASRGQAGWQYLFVAIDDASRLGFAAVYPDETADSALAFLDDSSASTPATGSASSGS